MNLSGTPEECQRYVNNHRRKCKGMQGLRAAFRFSEQQGNQKRRREFTRMNANKKNLKRCYLPYSPVRMNGAQKNGLVFPWAKSVARAAARAAGLGMPLSRLR